MLEFKILGNIIDFMEANGMTYEDVDLSINQKLADEINARHNSAYTVNELQIAADKCVAHNWLKRTSLDTRYALLEITPTGIGVARSKIKSDELKSSRTWLKKSSDWIENHKGLLAILTILTFVFSTLRFFGIL